ncbi:MAG: hypothetical protein M1835_003165 [Candelina submexicana]|nr:MAG: hypothetical protein M1835_003165 [Candelina submexicana]
MSEWPPSVRQSSPSLVETQALQADCTERCDDAGDNEESTGRGKRVAQIADGIRKYRRADEEEVETVEAVVRETHDLVLRHRQPYHFREKSDLYDFGETKVQFEHLDPCGLIIRPAGELTAKPSLRDVDRTKVRRLAQLQSPVVLRGVRFFAHTTERELFISKAYGLGEVLPWSFGILQEVKDHGKSYKLHNNVVSNESIPMHYDGMFKFVTQKDENGNDIKDEQGKEIKVQKQPK